MPFIGFNALGVRDATAIGGINYMKDGKENKLGMV